MTKTSGRREEKRSFCRWAIEEERKVCLGVQVWQVLKRGGKDLKDDFSGELKGPGREQSVGFFSF